MDKKFLQAKKINDKVFYYLELGNYRGYPDKIVWVNRKLVQHDEKGQSFIIFPCPNSKIEKTEKGNYVLRESPGNITYLLYKECGFRGSTKFSIPPDYFYTEYDYYHSPAGNLGISRGLIISVPASEKVIISWNRSGRLYGKPSKGVFILQEGKIQEIEGVSEKELEELENLLK